LLQELSTLSAAEIALKLKVVSRDAELPHRGVEGGAAKSETGGGRRDYPAALPQHPHHMLPLHLLQRGAAGGFRAVLLYFS